jgi:hypothetical protein
MSRTRRGKGVEGLGGAGGGCGVVGWSVPAD